MENVIDAYIRRTITIAGRGEHAVGRDGGERSARGVHVARFRRYE
jgi:hypothetical protein